VIEALTAESSALIKPETARALQRGRQNAL